MTEEAKRGRMTPEQVAQYEREGYVLYHETVLSSSDFARLKAIFEEDLEQYGENGLDVIHFKDARLLEFLLSDTVLDAVYFALQPNECSLHEARLIHGAQANTSERRRAGYTMRYFPTSSRVFPKRNQNHKIWLARGVDVAGNRYENA